MRNRSDVSLNAWRPASGGSFFLLPDEDPAVFEKMLDMLHRAYEPRSPVEARRVDRLARYQWRIARYQGWQETCHAKADALLSAVKAGRAGPQAELAAKRWVRTAENLADTEARLKRKMATLRNRLAKVLHARRKNLVKGVSDSSVGASDVKRVAPTKAAPRPAPVKAVSNFPPPPAPAAPWPATHAAVSENGNPEKRKARAEWNRLLQQLQPTVGHG